MRLTDLGILPNRFQMDITECFVIGAAWGDLPSERVYIRTETLSCLHKAGNIVTIDGDMKAQAIGEDGKLGLHGRVVTKQGAILANSMMAGFISGLSQAFKPRISYAPLTLTGNSTDNRSFELPPLQDSLTAAGVSGVGRTTELIAGFYLKQAQSLFPVIEIDSARHVDLVILKGMPLKFNVQRTAAGTIAQDTID
jgi:conjugal transfer pilus assembly protein TraB